MDVPKYIYFNENSQSILPNLGELLSFDADPLLKNHLVSSNTFQDSLVKRPSFGNFN